MTRLYSIFAALLIGQSLHGQSKNLGDWILRMEIGIEQHDKRLFELNVFDRERLLLQYADERWGTYHFGLVIQKKIMHSGIIEVYGGLGLGYENATFLRPFEHGYFSEGPSASIFLMQNRYRKLTVPMNINTYIRLTKQLIISTDIRLNWLIFRSITRKGSSWPGYPYTETLFELHDVHLRSGIVYRFGSLMFGINTRIVNFQIIDKIIFNDLLKDPRVDEKWEWYNPLMFDLSVGYTW